MAPKKQSNLIYGIK